MTYYCVKFLLMPGRKKHDILWHRWPPTGGTAVGLLYKGHHDNGRWIWNGQLVWLTVTFQSIIYLRTGNILQIIVILIQINNSVTEKQLFLPSTISYMRWSSLLLMHRWIPCSWSTSEVSFRLATRFQYNLLRLVWSLWIQSRILPFT